jgi:hypothetical protein
MVRNAIGDAQNLSDIEEWTEDDGPGCRVESRNNAIFTIFLANCSPDSYILSWSLPGAD